MIKINYDKIDPKCRKTVESIEKKPHVKYIRYLLSKRYSPIVIKKELQKLGLSAPHEKALTSYYLSVIDPFVKYYGLSKLYSDYKNRLLRAKSKRGDYAKNILNYRIELGQNLDGQVKFHMFIKTMDIDPMWISEIYRFHGSAVNFPTDDKGNRILSSTNSSKRKGSVEKILLFDKRFIIDKLLLENVPCSRIAEYCREKLKLNVLNTDISLYKTMFFNIQTQTLEEKIDALVCEKNSLSQMLEDIEEGLGEYEDLTMGDKVSLVEQTEKRIKELKDSISALNSLYTESAVRVAEINEMTFEEMFADIIGKSYARFQHLDQYKDRDVVDPLVKTVRMMGYAHDKVQEIKAISDGKSGNSDKHSQEVMLELYDRRVEEIVADQKKRVAGITGDTSYGEVSLDEIAGIDELSVSFDENEE